MKENILVIGGTGKTGRKVAERLSINGVSVRIGSRNGNPAFDWQDQLTWSKALEGVDKVYITFQPDLAVPGAREAIDTLVAESRKQGIQKLVLLSGKAEREAELCEQVIINSGIDYTILRANWFNQNFDEGYLLEPVKAGYVALPKPEALIPFVDTDDIADVAVSSLLNDRHNGQIYELTGLRALTFGQAVQEIAVAADRDIAFAPVSLNEYIRMLKGFEIPPDVIWLINYLFDTVLGTEQIAEISHDIEKVLGRKPKDFSSFAKEAAATGIWEPLSVSNKA